MFQHSALSSERRVRAVRWEPSGAHQARGSRDPSSKSHRAIARRAGRRPTDWGGVSYSALRGPRLDIEAPTKWSAQQAELREHY